MQNGRLLSFLQTYTTGPVQGLVDHCIAPLTFPANVS